MKSIIFFILPFLKNYRYNDNYRKYNDSMLYQHYCIEDEEMCVIQVVDEYNNNSDNDNDKDNDKDNDNIPVYSLDDDSYIDPNILRKYLTEDAIEDYEDCILSGNEGCDTYWYIDKNYTQWKIENGIISYLDKKPLKWVNIKNKDSEN